MVKWIRKQHNSGITLSILGRGTKLVYRAVVKPQSDNHVTSNMEQSLDTTKQPSPSDSSKNGMTYINDDLSLDELRNFVNQKAEEESVIEFIGNNTNDGCTLRGKQDDKISSKKPSSSLEVINEDSDTDVDEVLLPDIGTSFPSSSFGGGQSLEKEILNAYDDDYEDQFEEYPSSYEEFCDQFDFKVKGRVWYLISWLCYYLLNWWNSLMGVWENTIWVRSIAVFINGEIRDAGSGFWKCNTIYIIDKGFNMFGMDCGPSGYMYSVRNNVLISSGLPLVLGSMMVLVTRWTQDFCLYFGPSLLNVEDLQVMIIYRINCCHYGRLLLMLHLKGLALFSLLKVFPIGFYLGKVFNEARFGTALLIYTLLLANWVQLMVMVQGEMEKGFLNGPRSKKDDIDSKSGLSIQDLAKKIKNIDGKLIGKDGKHLKAIRGDPKPAGLGTKVAVEGSNLANVTKAAPHNPKDKPLKSILKTHGDSVNLNEGVDGCVRVERGVCTQPACVDVNSCSSVPNVTPVSYAAMMGSTSNKRVNIKSLVHENGVPGAHIALPKESVDEIANKFANTLYGYFIGRKHAFQIVDNYVKNAWARFGLKRTMFHHGFFFFQFSSKTGMEQVLANGPWHIRMIPIMLNIWNPTKKLIRDDIKTVPVWVKMHDVPVVAYSEVGLSLITTQVGRPIMLDAHTADMCVNSWGRCSYARALIELNADQTLKESIIVAVPIQGEEGHSLETINIEYEWRPPRCDNCKIFDHLDEDCPRKPKDTSVQNREDGFTQVKGKNKQPKKHTPRYIEGLRINKPKTTLVYRAVTKPSPPKENSSKTSSTNVPSTNKNFINDDLDFMELKNSFDKLREENVILEEVMPAVQEEK
ncbi:zinc knuckle CX2CX4HX4C containing protein, partial [Tanacetum coccineum]